MNATDSLLVLGARVIDPARGVDNVQDVLFADGRVVPAGSVTPDHTIDATGLILAPGFVDLHCHLREPGYEYK